MKGFMMRPRGSGRAGLQRTVYGLPPFAYAHQVKCEFIIMYSWLHTS